MDYYKMVDERQLIDITNKKYDFVLIDLGSFEDMYDMDTFLRADIKVVMCHGADWKTRHLRKFYEIWVLEINLRNGKYTYLTCLKNGSKK